MRNFLTILIDFIFPPSKIELELRTLSPIQFSEAVIKASPTEFPFISSLFSYKHPLVRELIWQIKYKRNKNALRIAGYNLYRMLQKYDYPVTLIPIPVSNKRRKERGYNQCELIIDEIMKHDIDGKLRSDYHLLRRSKNIEKQTFKNRSERILNTKNIFEVTRETKNDEKIIIIDDVTTTGSTLREAREILLQNRFSIIQGLTIAH
jgi:competence protein ComFC